MKNFKIIISLSLIILTISFIFFGCSNIGNSLDPTKQLIGQWALTDDESNDEIRMINDDFPVDNFYIYENGQMAMNGGNATYSIQNNEFTISTFFGGTHYYEYSTDGNRLTLTRTNGNHKGYTAYYERIN